MRCRNVNSIFNKILNFIGNILVILYEQCFNFLFQKIKLTITAISTSNILKASAKVVGIVAHVYMTNQPITDNALIRASLQPAK